MPFPTYTTTVLSAWFGRVSDGWLTGVTKNLSGTVYNIVKYIQANWVDSAGWIQVPQNLLAVFNDPTPDGKGLQVAMEISWVPASSPGAQPTVQVLRFNQGTQATWAPGSTSNVYDGPLFPPTRYRLRIFDTSYGPPIGAPSQTTKVALDGTPMDEYMSRYFVFIRAADNAVCIQTPKAPVDHFGDPAPYVVKNLTFYYEMTNWALAVLEKVAVPDGQTKLVWSRSVEVYDAWYGYDAGGLRAGVTAKGVNIAQFVDASWPSLSDGYAIPPNFANAFFDAAPNKPKQLALQVLDKITGDLFYLKFNTSSTAQTWSVHGNKGTRGSAPEYTGPLAPEHGATLRISDASYGKNGYGYSATALDGTSDNDYISKYFVFINASGQPSVTAPYSMNSHFGDPAKTQTKTLSFIAHNPTLARQQRVDFNENAGGAVWSFETGLTHNPNGQYTTTAVTAAWQARKATCDKNMPPFSTYVQGLVKANTSQNGFPGTPSDKPTVAILISGGGWRAMDSGAQFFDMLKTSAVNLMSLVSIVHGVSGGSWATSLSLATGTNDRFRLAPYTDTITDPGALPQGLVNILSYANASAAYDSVTSGGSRRAFMLAAIMAHFPQTYLVAAAAGALLYAYDPYYPAFVKSWVWDGSRTFLGNYTMLLGRQFGLIPSMSAELGVGLWQQSNAPIGFLAAVNRQKPVDNGSDNWFAFDGVPVDNEVDSNKALGGITRVARFERGDLHGAIVEEVDRFGPLTDYPARTLDAAAALGICGSAPAFFYYVLKPFDGEGFVGTIKTTTTTASGRHVNETPLWDAGCDINVPFPLATGYLATVGRPDICIVLDCSEGATYAEDLETAIEEGWYAPYNGSSAGWDAKYDMTGGEVRVYFPKAGSQYPIVIYGFGDRLTSTAKMSRTPEELQATRAIVQRTAANVKTAFDWVMNLASTAVPSTGFQAFKSAPSAQPPAPTPQVAIAAPSPQGEVYSLDLFGFLFAAEIAVWWSNPTAPVSLQRDVALHHLFRDEVAAEALATAATGDAGLGKAVAAFLLEKSVNGVPIRLAHAWANDLGRRVDSGDPAGDTALADELSTRSLNSAAVPSALAPEFRAWVVVLFALRYVQNRAVLRVDDLQPARAIQLLELLERRGTPEIHFTGTAATPLRDLADMVKTGAPKKPVGAP